TFADALETLAPYLSKSLLHDALKAARKIDNIFDRIDALSYLTPHFPPKLKEEVRHEIAQTISLIDNESAKAKPSIRLAACSSEKERATICSQILNAARMIIDSDYKAEILTQLIPLLSEDLREVVSREAFEAAQESNVPSKSALIVPLIPHLP